MTATKRGPNPSQRLASALRGTGTLAKSRRDASDPDPEVRTQWAYVSRKSIELYEQRLDTETDPFILGELVERAVGTPMLTQARLLRAAEIGGRAGMHAACTPAAPATARQAFLRGIRPGHDPFKPWTFPAGIQRAAAAHPRLLAGVIARCDAGLLGEVTDLIPDLIPATRRHDVRRHAHTRLRAAANARDWRSAIVFSELLRHLNGRIPREVDWLTVLADAPVTNVLGVEQHRWSPSAPYGLRLRELRHTKRPSVLLDAALTGRPPHWRRLFDEIAPTFHGTLRALSTALDALTMTSPSLP